MARVRAAADRGHVRGTGRAELAVSAVRVIDGAGRGAVCGAEGRRSFLESGCQGHQVVGGSRRLQESVKAATEDP
ncbi:hypothetical protein ALI44B_00150 [Leifsonia sp. ALI-44-B]|nr:hypothetical protein ALI44B_00150 [Leifsonia sp. ALI-44-B]